MLINSMKFFFFFFKQKTAYEIVQELGAAPDYLCIPVGNAGNITAYWLGFREAHDLGWADTKPKMMGFQAEGAAPIVKGEPVSEPESVASALKVGNPASWKGAVDARDESGGVIESVSDREILEDYRAMARRGGIFCEPASAASVAGLLKLSRDGVHLKGKRVVCVITGSGLKDPDVAADLEPLSMREYPADQGAVEKALSRT